MSLSLGVLFGLQKSCLQREFGQKCRDQNLGQKERIVRQLERARCQLAKNPSPAWGKIIGNRVDWKFYMKIKPRASVSKITFSGGQSIDFVPSDKVILVGANNSGKSLTLREVTMCAANGKHPHALSVKSLEFSKSGTPEDFESYLKKHAKMVGAQYRMGQWAIDSSQLYSWKNANLGGEFHGACIKNINANNRLSICNLQKSKARSDHPSVPQHVLYDDDSLMERVSNLFFKAFGQYLMINHRGGSQIPIHVGQPPSPETGSPGSESYVDALESIPQLHEQGDGVKSYTGILFETVVSDIDITLIDEPEAFLHPPQMRRLGETLASEVPGQLFVATHSSDIMRGFLEGTKGNVRILRIRREGDKNLVAEAAPDTVKELWSTPVLRYSNALEGVFHEQAILCEDHSDCRLFNAIADHLSTTQAEQWLDTAYIPAGGKQAIPTIARVLRKIGVPTKAVFDVDLLRDKGDLKKAIEAFGGDWDEFQTYWGRVNAAVTQKIKVKSDQEMKELIKTIIDKSGSGKLPKREISDAMKLGGAWNEVKRNGPTALPRGEVQSDYENLINKLEQIGIYLVPVGEVEGFCPDVGKHGPGFVNEVLTTKDLDDQKLEDLRAFVAKFHQGEHAPLEDAIEEDGAPPKEDAGSADEMADA